MNLLVISGRLGRDPELKYTQDGNPVCKFSLAVDRRPKTDTPDWIDVTCFQKLAELCNEYLTRGAKATVVGRLQLRSWETKDGVKQRGVEIVAQEVEFGERSSSSGPPPPRRPVEEEEVPF